jgi:eukaryotic-like serine/threonine-protein kinase
MSARPDSFQPSERFSILRRVGAGGMGVVYEAFDRERKVRVALKTLSKLDPERLYLFKQEFRALADITHPNLAKLYELISEGGQWYFTMEFVDGENLLQFAWHDPPRATPSPAPQPVDDTTPTACLDTISVGAGVRLPPVKHIPTVVRTERRAPFDQIRGVLRQMAEGIDFLHTAGKLHRDIKPSNIMVTAEGRVVLLDFGLISELRHDVAKPGFISGTVAYMAPEQAIGAPLTEAADWYATGCTLYEVLTGRPPFDGDYDAIIHAKLTVDPPAPGSVVAGVPEDLAQLCMDLLRRLPESRPPGTEILRRVGGQMAAPEPGLRHSAQTLLVGRERHLQELRGFFSTAEAGRPTLTFVHGPSGFGKTFLIDAFLEELSQKKGALVLRGRCYEQESVPYKGFDSLVDALVRHLQSLPQEELKAVLPRNREALAKLFPVIQRVGLAGEAPRSDIRQADRLELRRMAFDALWELFQRLASRQPLVLFIDDLHWGDLDSASLLTEILRSSGRLPLLVVCSYRSEYARTSQCLKAVWESRFDPAVQRRELVVGPLDPLESERLALTVLTGDIQTRMARARAVAREAKGSPFFVLELASYIHEEQASGSAAATEGPGGSDLDRLLWNRVGRLPASARTLLEVLAVSGQPLRRLDACRVAAQGVDDPSVMTILRAGRFVRSAGMTREDEIETYHDRIREAIITCLPSDIRCEHHRNLAHTLENAGDIDPERLAVHFYEGGERRKAGQYYRLGADRASQALAFDRACGLYQKALELQEAGDSSRHQLAVQLADAFANAGRGPQAAQQYLAACATAASESVLPLKQKAAYQFCASGHVDQGKEAFRQVLAAVGTGLPKTPRAAIASVLWHKLRLQVRGLHFHEQPAHAVKPALLSRLDALSSAATGLGMVDLVAGADFAARFLLLALQVGEPSHMARALSWHAMHASGGGGPRAEAKALPLLALSRAVAEHSDDPLALAWTRLAAGVSYLQFCRWRDSVETLEETVQVLRKDCRDVAWEIATASTCQLLALNDLGDYVEMARKCPPLLKDAMDRGDMYAATNIGTWVVPQIRLAEDDAAGARESIRDYESRWSQQGFHLQHLWALISEIYVDLYQGQAEAALRRLEQRWPAASGSLLFRSYLPRTFSYHVRARAYLQAAESAADPGPLLARVLRDCNCLEREKTPFTSAATLLLQAGIANLRRDQEATVALLRRAEQAFMATDMNAYVAAVRFRLASVLGGDEGRELSRRSSEWMEQQRIRDPERMVALHVPGFGR